MALQAPIEGVQSAEKNGVIISELRPRLISRRTSAFSVQGVYAVDYRRKGLLGSLRRHV